MTNQEIYDRFFFLEGLVNETTFRNIGEEAIKIAQEAREESAVESLSCEVNRLRATLSQIARWELPATGKFWDEEKTRPTSYETEYGSNGARAYIRTLALDALDASK